MAKGKRTKGQATQWSKEKRTKGQATQWPKEKEQKDKRITKQKNKCTGRANSQATVNETRCHRYY